MWASPATQRCSPPLLRLLDIEADCRRNGLEVPAVGTDDQVSASMAPSTTLASTTSVVTLAASDPTLGGDREAKSAPYLIVLNRLSWHEPTKAYMARRTAQGKSKKAVIRCLKPYVAREVYRAIMTDLSPVAQANSGMAGKVQPAQVPGTTSLRPAPENSPGEGAVTSPGCEKPTRRRPKNGGSTAHLARTPPCRSLKSPRKRLSPEEMANGFRTGLALSASDVRPKGQRSWEWPSCCSA